MSKQKDNPRGKLIGVWLTLKEQDKLKLIQDKLRTRNRVATIRELIRRFRL